MATLFDVIAEPGRVLIENYVGGKEDRHEYFSVVAKIYSLLNRMHGEVLDLLTEARLAQDRGQAVRLMGALLNPDFLTSAFRAQALCDELEEQGRALLSQPNVRLDPETQEFVHALANRERGSAKFYVREFEPRIQQTLSIESFFDFQSALTDFRDELVEQQAAFMERAEDAIRRAGE
jgi:hypothetical protein